MSARDSLYRRFAERFHAGKRLRPATEAQVAAAEATLSVPWPASSRRFARTCGSLYTPSLLTLVVERKPGFADVQQFCTPREVITETRGSGLQPGGRLVVFATDSGGNNFLFRDLLAAPLRSDDAPVWLFDHDMDEITVQAESFDAWLGQSLEL